MVQHDAATNEFEPSGGSREVKSGLSDTKKTVLFTAFGLVLFIGLVLSAALSGGGGPSMGRSIGELGQTLVGSIVLLVVFGLGFLVYLFPGIIAICRKHPHTGGILLVTLLTGWTGIAWIATLIWSFITPQAPVAPIIVSPSALPPAPPMPPLPAVPAGDAVVQDLRNLADLLDRQLITAEEFESQKRKLLSN